MKFKRSKKDTTKKVVAKEISAETAAPGKVDTIIKALSGLESDIDSQNEKLADMKKQLNQTAQREIDKLKDQITQMATKEAEIIISTANEKAKSQSDRIQATGDLNLKDVQSKIDAKFGEAVDHVVSTILKA